MIYSLKYHKFTHIYTILEKFYSVTYNWFLFFRLSVIAPITNFLFHELGM